MNQIDSAMRTRVCPCCALACDDVQITDGIHPPENIHCPIAERYPLSPEARGQTPRFQNDQRLQVVTTGVDLLTARTLFELHDAGKIEVRIEADPSLAALATVISRDGTVSATLGDVLRHADLVWALGQVSMTWPRLLDKLAIQEGTATERLLVCQGDQLTADQLADLVRSTPDEPPSDNEPSSLTWLHSAEYLAVLVGPAAFADGQEEIAAAMLARLVRNRNETKRAVLLTLDAALTLKSVFLWRSNQIPEFAQPGASTDIRIGTPLANSQIAAQLQIGGVDPGREIAYAFQPAAMAGLHTASTVMRGDGAVTLPLAAPVPCQLPTISDQLRQLLA